MKPRVIAFYLPQFHPVKENNEWWGEGFTEWTNVGKAKPLFLHHKQPKVPTDLGYYDLRIEDVREKQAAMAKEAGIEGFCYWHYFFGDGKQLLERPLQEVVKTGKPNFPFCLGWANESWEKKLWNKDSKGNITLIEQKYGEENYRAHYKIVLPILKDERYIKVDGKPLFFIYRPNKIPNATEFINLWRFLYREETGGELHFVAHADENDEDFGKYFEMGFDAVYSNRVQAGAKGIQKNILNTVKYTLCKILGLPRLVNFKDVMKKSVSDSDKAENIYPGIICGWDHTPRSGKKGYVYYNFSLSLFRKHVAQVCEIVKEKSPEHQIIFLKSWNEWGEGNFMEPDMEFKRGKVEILKKVLDGKE